MHYPEGVVGYTSTHDTDTWVGYFEGLPERQRDCFRYNVGADGDRPPEWEIIIDEGGLGGGAGDDDGPRSARARGANRGSTSREPSMATGSGASRRDALDDAIADRLWDLAGRHVR